MIHTLKFIFLFLILTYPIFGQRADFYDPYDYSMKNYKGGDNVGQDNYREYDLPPKFQKPALVTPKNVQRQSDYNSLLQGQQIGIRRSPSPTQNQIPQTNNLPINPLTGEINPEAILRQRETERLKKEKKREFLNREIEPYTETRARRMAIIFLTTLPFSIPLSVGITYLIGQMNGNGNFLKTTPGFMFTALIASGFSAANMIADINRYDEYMKNKRENNVDIPPIDQQSLLNKNNLLNFSFTIGSKSF